MSAHIDARHVSEWLRLRIDGVLAPAVGEDGAGLAVRLLLALRTMFMKADTRAERHKLMHALAELFAPVLNVWVDGANADNLHQSLQQIPISRGILIRFACISRCGADA